MKKLFTFAALALTAAAFTPATAQDLTFDDYGGGYVCTVAEGIEGSYEYDWTEEWIGHKMKIQVEQSGCDEGKMDLNFQNFFPQGYYSAQRMYVRMDDPATRSAFVISKRSSVGSWDTRKHLYSSDPNAQDLDIDCSNWDNYLAGDADGLNDLVITWSEDLNSFTVENLIASATSDGADAFKAAKIVYEKSMSPDSPNFSGSFNAATGFNDIAITLPSAYDYDSGSGDIKVNLDKLVLERSFDYGSTYTKIKEWVNSDETPLVPGAVINYTDEDIDFDNLPVQYFYYQATVYLGNGSNSRTGGISVGVSAPQVKNLTAVAGEKGALPVTIKFNLPTEEDLIMPLTKVEICRYDYSTWSDVVLETYTEDLTPEREIIYVDNEAKQDDSNAYRVYTYWKYGKGQNSTSAYVGLDKPGSVTNFEAKPESSTKVVLTWEAPTKGQSGGYIDPAATLYKLTRRLSDDWGEWKYDEASGAWNCVYTSLVELAVDMTETTYTDAIDEEPEGLYQYTYELYTYVAGQEDLGYGGSLTTCFGTDTPGSPANLKADVDMNTVNLSWEAPTSGARGGYYDPESVLYKVTRRLSNDGGVYDYNTYVFSYPSQVIIAQDIKETSLVDKLDIDRATSYCYEVIAYVEGNNETRSNILDVMVGPKNSVGFKESFEAKDADGYAQCENAWDIQWQSVECEPANYVYYGISDTYHDYTGEDESGNKIANQFLIFKHYDSGYWWAYEGGANATPYNFDFTNADMPVLLYRVLMLPTENNGKLSIGAGTLAEGETVNDLPVYATECSYDPEFELVDNEPTWRDCIAPLPELAGNSDCLINFHYETGKLVQSRAFFAIDDIEVRDYKAPAVTVESNNTKTEKTHALTWTDPSTNDLLVEAYEIYRTKTQKTAVQEPGATEYDAVYPESDLGNEFELIATLEGDTYDTKYVDNMIAADGKTFDATKHIYKVVAVYNDPQVIKSSSKPVQVAAGAAIIEEPVTGIGAINADKAATRYFNLQGQPIESPAKGQIVIEVKDGQASKIVR